LKSNMSKMNYIKKANEHERNIGWDINIDQLSHISKKASELGFGHISMETVECVIRVLSNEEFLELEDE